MGGKVPEVEGGGGGEWVIRRAMGRRVGVLPRRSGRGGWGCCRKMGEGEGEGGEGGMVV